MTDQEIQAILEEIVELARLIGWSSALAQNKDNQILGIYLGEYEWIRAKIGNTEQKQTH